MVLTPRLNCRGVKRPSPWITEFLASIMAYTDSQFVNDLIFVPRAVAERHANLHRWTVMPRGGHFAAAEEPDLLVEDLREFFRPLR